MKPEVSTSDAQGGASETVDKFTLCVNNVSSRLADAPSTIGNRASVVKKRNRGRPREGRSMGRYPFLTWATKYLDRIGNLYAEETLKERRRRMRRMAKDFQSLKEGGLIDTTDPTRMTEKEISAYLRLQRSRGLSESGQAHNISALRSILRFCGNPVLDKMRMEYGSMLPKMRSKRQSPLEVPDLETIYRTASNVSDWRRLQAYALVILALNTGLRTKELRTAKVGDIDKDSWSLTVKHPKGEGTYGEERKVPILPPAKTIIRRYLVARAEIVSSYAPLNEALFPAMKDKGDGYYTGNGLRKLKSIVERETRVDLDFRACRRTFGQTCVDKGVQIESVSIALGHSSTKTTEGYYCRKREDTALREIYSAWKEEIPTSAIKPLIEKDKYFSGYA